MIGKIDRAGVLSQQIYLNYSQERLASYGLRPAVALIARAAFPRQGQFNDKGGPLIASGDRATPPSMS